MSSSVRFGPYRVVRELARGGMGVVYEVVHESTGASYALKTAQVGLDPTGEERERFVREAQALASLDHPHVVRVHTASLHESTPFLVQDLLPGGTLSARLRDGPLPVDGAVEIIRKLAAGLHHAHQRGSLHRDLKPGNVLFDDRGEPRLCDFGLTRPQQAESLTATGTVLGTPSYMAPEQAQGAAVDVRADVYGLAAILYACLTGQPPFPPRGSVLATLAAVTREPPPPLRSLRAEIPPALEAVCLRALAKDPDDRYPDVAAFAEALCAEPAGPPPRGPGLLAAGAVVALALAAITALAASGSGDGQPPPSRQLTNADGRTPDHLAEARAALARGDADQALTATRAGAATGQGAASTRRRLEGLALWLQGDLAGAEERLAGTPAGGLAGWERQRRQVARQVRGLRGGAPAQAVDAALEELDRMATETQVALAAANELDAVLRTRFGQTVLAVPLELELANLRGAWPRLERLLERVGPVSHPGLPGLVQALIADFDCDGLSLVDIDRSARVLEFVEPAAAALPTGPQQDLALALSTINGPRAEVFVPRGELDGPLPADAPPNLLRLLDRLELVRAELAMLRFQKAAAARDAAALPTAWLLAWRHASRRLEIAAARGRLRDITAWQARHALAVLHLVRGERGDTRRLLDFDAPVPSKEQPLHAALRAELALLGGRRDQARALTARALADVPESVLRASDLFVLAAVLEPNAPFRATMLSEAANRPQCWIPWRTAAVTREGGADGLQAWLQTELAGVDATPPPGGW